eukprot:maker-scaffold227_size249015-snap-gene-1.28 protein:Tk04439 transcript:maker-scaffold227_size249015-snap-gene-1.28-mRNA-1 annotation:"portal protein"
MPLKGFTLSQGSGMSHVVQRSGTKFQRCESSSSGRLFVTNQRKRRVIVHEDLSDKYFSESGKSGQDYQGVGDKNEAITRLE